MQKMNALKCLIFVCNIAIAFCVTCPSPETISPCQCVADNTVECGNYNPGPCIRCGGNSKLDMSAIFQNMSQQLSDEEKAQNFGLFYLNNTRVDYIPANVFQDIKFDRVVFEESTNITRVNADAFGSNSTIKFFEGKLVVKRDYRFDLFHALQTLINAEQIKLLHHNLTSIQSYGFQNLSLRLQSQLIVVSFSYGELRRIEDNAFFDLPNIQYLSFYSNRIEYIAPRAFRMRYPSDVKLNIDLQRNNLNASSFATDSFDYANRPVYINLADNRIEYLDESVFKPILLMNQRNSISMTGNVVVCDCRMNWIIRERSAFKQSQINRMLCSNMENRNIWNVTEAELRCAK